MVTTLVLISDICMINIEGLLDLEKRTKMEHSVADNPLNVQLKQQFVKIPYLDSSVQLEVCHAKIRRRKNKRIFLLPGHHLDGGLDKCRQYNH